MATLVPQNAINALRQSENEIASASNVPTLKLALRTLVRAVRRLKTRQDRMMSEIKKNRADIKAIQERLQ